MGLGPETPAGTPSGKRAETGPFAIGETVRFIQPGKDSGKWGEIAGPVRHDPKNGTVLAVKWLDLVSKDDDGVRSTPLNLVTFWGKFAPESVRSGAAEPQAGDES